MPQISIRPGDSLTVAEDITIQFDKFDFIHGCSRLHIYDAYHELTVVRGPEPNHTGEKYRIVFRDWRGTLLPVFPLWSLSKARRF